MKKNPVNEVCEIQLRYSKSTPLENEKIHSSDNAFKYIINAYNKETIGIYEEFMVVLVNNANIPLGVCKIGKGGITSTSVDLRLIFATALKGLATSIIITHNHPSGNKMPSEQDIQLTRKIQEAGKLLDIRLLDHIIVTPQNSFYSFADSGQL